MYDGARVDMVQSPQIGLNLAIGQARKALIGSLSGKPQSLKAALVMPSAFSLKAKLAQCRTQLTGVTVASPTTAQ
jgi:hypothetical protein